MSSFERAWKSIKKDASFYPERDDEIEEVVRENMAEKRKEKKMQPKPKIDLETGGPENASIRALLNRARGVPRKDTSKRPKTDLKTSTLRNLHSKVKKD